MLKELIPYTPKGVMLGTWTGTMKIGTKNVKIRIIDESPLPWVKSKLQKESIDITSYSIDSIYHTIIGVANDTASEVESSLDSFLISYFTWFKENILSILACKIDIKDISTEIRSREFMDCRNILSEILKKDKRLGGKTPNTKLFYAFIIERNKYAHGQIGILATRKNHVIQYEDPDKKIITSILTEEIVQSFIDTGFYLRDWMSELHTKIGELNKELNNE